MPNFQQTADVRRVDRCEFSELPKLQCACVTLAEQLGGRLSLFCTFPCGHWIKANIQCGHPEVVCLFKQETPEGVRRLQWKRGRNPTTRHRNIASQIASYIYRHPATIASLWSEGLLGPTDQKHTQKQLKEIQSHCNDCR